VPKGYNHVNVVLGDAPRLVLRNVYTYTKQMKREFVSRRFLSVQREGKLVATNLLVLFINPCSTIMAFWRAYHHLNLGYFLFFFYLRKALEAAVFEILNLIWMIFQSTWGVQRQHPLFLLRAPRAEGARNICMIRGLHDAHRTRILRITFAWHMRKHSRRTVGPLCTCIFGWVKDLDCAWCQGIICYWTSGITLGLSPMPEISDFQRTNSEFAKSEQKYPVKITLAYVHV
jgi:hypothetical protein